MRRLNEAAGSPAEFAAVRHLVELGYEDPLEAAARRAAVERMQQAKLKEAEARLEAGELTAAIDLLESAVDAESEWTAPHHLLARAYFRAGRLDAAGERLAWLESHGAEHAELALLRAKLALRARSLDAARDHAEYAKCLHDPLPAADVLIGEIDYRRGDLAAAEAAYRRAFVARGQNAAALGGLAAIALRRGELEQAVDWSLQAIEQEMRLMSAHYRLGIALFKLQRWREAIAALQTAVALDPMIAGPYRWLSQLAAAQGEAEAAAGYRQQGAAVIAGRRAARRA